MEQSALKSKSRQFIVETRKANLAAMIRQGRAREDLGDGHPPYLTLVDIESMLRESSQPHWFSHNQSQISFMLRSTSRFPEAAAIFEKTDFFVRVVGFLDGEFQIPNDNRHMEGFYMSLLSFLSEFALDRPHLSRDPKLCQLFCRVILGASSLEVANAASTALTNQLIDLYREDSDLVRHFKSEFMKRVLWRVGSWFQRWKANPQDYPRFDFSGFTFLCSFLHDAKLLQFCNFVVEEDWAEPIYQMFVVSIRSLDKNGQEMQDHLEFIYEFIAKYHGDSVVGFYLDTNTHLFLLEFAESANYDRIRIALTLMLALLVFGGDEFFSVG
jgi:hypothetical protein